MSLPSLILPPDWVSPRVSNHVIPFLFFRSVHFLRIFFRPLPPHAPSPAQQAEVPFPRFLENLLLFQPLLNLPSDSLSFFFSLYGRLKFARICPPFAFLFGVRFSGEGGRRFLEQSGCSLPVCTPAITSPEAWVQRFFRRSLSRLPFCIFLSVSWAYKGSFPWIISICPSRRSRPLAYLPRHFGF